MIDCDCTTCACSKKHPQLNAPRCWQVTSATVTDEQIRSLTAADGIDQDLGDYATVAELVRFAVAGRPSARRRCAELLNARAKESR